SPLAPSRCSSKCPAAPRRHEFRSPFMLSKQDDFIGHQLPTTFDHVMSSDPAWMERLWYTGHPVPAGDLPLPR
ncbi:MAG TPA: hypothetical protein VGJ20_08135, partial [Xanthobacteraceae bacterium]